MKINLTKDGKEETWAISNWGLVKLVLVSGSVWVVFVYCLLFLLGFIVGSGSVMLG